MKILSIGNSFSEDAQRWLHSIAVSEGDEIDTYNLYISGCSLERHWNCITNDLCDYGILKNGTENLGKTSIANAISGDKFDIITLQQASGFSGRPQTYIPFLTDIAGFVAEHQPDAQIYFHETWSYEVDSTHKHLTFYNNDQWEMYRRIKDASAMAARLIGVPLIPVGDVIQSIRSNVKEFDYQNGGHSLCRDGFHLSYLYGRFAAAATWYKVFTGKNADHKKFAAQNSDFDADLLKVLSEHLCQLDM